MQAHITGHGFGFGGGLLGSVKRVFAVIAALGVGALVLFAAGVMAVAAAIVGVIIAFVAMLLRFGAYGSIRTSRRSQTTTTTNADGEVVLEARRTARGWTVDG